MVRSPILLAVFQDARLQRRRLARAGALSTHARHWKVSTSRRATAVPRCTTEPNGRGRKLKKTHNVYSQVVLVRVLVEAIISLPPYLDVATKVFPQGLSKGDGEWAGVYLIGDEGRLFGRRARGISGSGRSCRRARAASRDGRSSGHLRRAGGGGGFSSGRGDGFGRSRRGGRAGW